MFYRIFSLSFFNYRERKIELDKLQSQGYYWNSGVEPNSVIIDIHHRKILLEKSKVEKAREQAAKHIKRMDNSR